LVASQTELQKIFDQIDFNPAVSERDLQNHLKSFESLGNSASNRLATMIRSSQFLDWIASPGSNVLFVNFTLQASNQDTVSAFLCANLIDAVGKESELTGVLSVFCRDHSSSSDPAYGPKGLLQSLLGQLLQQFPSLDHSYLRIRKRRNAVSMDILFDAIECMLGLLPQECVLFCIIEGITVYEERPSAYDDIEEVMQFLIDMSQRSGGCALKLLFTCPWNSHMLYKLVPDQDRSVLWIRTDVGAQTHLTSTAWNSLMDANFSFLR
jgi:hypothetical protein